MPTFLHHQYGTFFFFHYDNCVGSGLSCEITYLTWTSHTFGHQLRVQVSAHIVLCSIIVLMNQEHVERGLIYFMFMYLISNYYYVIIYNNN